MVSKESIRIALTHAALHDIPALSMLLTSRMLIYLLLAKTTLGGMLSSHVLSTTGRQPDVTAGSSLVPKFMQHDKLGLIN